MRRRQLNENGTGATKKCVVSPSKVTELMTRTSYHNRRKKYWRVVPLGFIRGSTFVLGIAIIYTCCLLSQLDYNNHFSTSGDRIQRKRVVVISNDAMRSLPISDYQPLFNLNNEDEESICQPLVPWQDVTRVNCNIFHEIDLTNDYVTLVNHGYIRAVWRVNNDLEGDVVALKTILFAGHFSITKMEDQANDAKISDHLTSSESIVNTYGYCGYSGMYEYSDEGSLEDNYTSFNENQKMNAAIDVAKGLADLHGLGSEGQSAIIHNDIAVRQFISFNRRYKLNDFNTARFLHWNHDENALCPSIMQLFPDKNRSPEEMRDEYNFVDEKMDIYSLGNIFYKLIMKERKYENFTKEEARDLILRGDVPAVKINDDTDEILKNAMIMCIQLNPQKRSSAKMVYDYLVASTT